MEALTDCPSSPLRMSFEKLKVQKKGLGFQNIAEAAQQAVHGAKPKARLGAPTLETRKAVKTEFTARYVQEQLESMDYWPCERWQWTFAHYLKLVASPCLHWISRVLEGQPDGPWSEGLQRCLDSLKGDFVGVEDTEQDVQSLVRFGAFLIRSHLSVSAHEGRLHEDILHLVRHGMPPIVTSVNLVLLSPTAMRPMIGESLHEDLARKVLATAAQLELPARAEPLETCLKRELVDHLSSKLKVAAAEQPLVSDEMAQKRSRTSEALEKL